jgi:hypothetical protein
MVAWNRNQLSTKIPMVSPIFHARDISGRHQISGRARGPTQAMARTINEVRKYQGVLSCNERGTLDASRNSPQCLHFIASSWISSAQKGHFFIVISPESAAKKFSLDSPQYPSQEKSAAKGNSLYSWRLFGRLLNPHPFHAFDQGRRLDVQQPGSAIISINLPFTHPQCIDRVLPF